MKKFMFAMAAAMTLVLSVGTTAEAQQRGSDRRGDRHDDRRDEDPRNDRRDSRGGIIIDIGVDGIDAYVDYDRRDDRRDRRDDRWDPRPRPQRRFVCFAEDRRGRLYRATDSDPRFAQEHALDRCYAVANRCRPLGCQRR